MDYRYITYPMTQPENIFLTDNRRNVLEGESDWSQKAIINEKGRIRTRADAALEELIEVAESPHVDNTQTFDPDDLFRFLQAVLTPDPEHVESGGLVGGADIDDDVPEDAQADVSDDFRHYRDHVQVQLAKLVIEDPTRD
jgi:hypothetical protein